MTRYIFFLILFLSASKVSYCSESNIEPPKKILWPFEGAFGKFDKQAAQRGFQVYKEVCSTCHSMDKITYGDLTKIGFQAVEAKEIAKGYTIQDGPNDKGEMFERPRVLSDKFANPYPNEQAARLANNSAYPPDLSLIIKARHNGANYVYSILTGYEDAPQDFKLGDGLSYNPYFAGKQIAMPAPLVDGQVQYMDGTHASVEQMARDVVVFLQWAAEPEMEHRKSLGLKSLIFLFIFTALFYVAKKRIWSRIEK